MWLAQPQVLYSMLMKLPFDLTVDKKSSSHLKNIYFLSLWMICERNKPSRSVHLNNYRSRKWASRLPEIKIGFNFFIGWWSKPVWKKLILRRKPGWNLTHHQFYIKKNHLYYGSKLICSKMYVLKSVLIWRP